MVPDRQKVRTDGRNGWMDGRTTPKLYPSDFVGGIIKDLGDDNHDMI